jgi:hypothetical protein
MRTTTAHSRRQVGATRRAGIFLAFSHAFLSSGVPERVPEGRGWPGLAGWMKTQIRTKTRTRDATGPIYAVRMKKTRAGGLVGRVSGDALSSFFGTLSL